MFEEEKTDLCREGGGTSLYFLMALFQSFSLHQISCWFFFFLSFICLSFSVSLFFSVCVVVVAVVAVGVVFLLQTYRFTLKDSFGDGMKYFTIPGSVTLVCPFDFFFCSFFLPFTCI